MCSWCSTLRDNSLELRRVPGLSNNVWNKTTHQSYNNHNSKEEEHKLLPMRRRKVDPHAQLANTAQLLLKSWRGCNFGLGTNKSARQFTTTESNQSNGMKLRCSRRMHIWRVQVCSFNAGLALEEAIQRIVDACNTDKPAAIVLHVRCIEKNQSYNLDGLQSFCPWLLINQQ